MTTNVNQAQDPWAEWLLRGRQQGLNATQLRRQQRGLELIRNRTLRAARLRKGQRVLDVGAGTGLLTLEACRRVGPDGEVCGLDLSRAALQEARQLEAATPQAGALTLVVGDALALPFANSSFDVVLTRSVLIYVENKAAAAREFYRVLKPGGRVSLFEPINSVARKYTHNHGGRDLTAVQPEYDQVAAYQRANWPYQAAMMDFDERDLLRWFVAAGFNVQLTQEHWEGRGRPLTARQQARWRSFMAGSLTRRGNPTLMSYAEAATAVLGERAAAHLEQLVNLTLTQPYWSASALTYLRGVRPKR